MALPLRMRWLCSLVARLAVLGSFSCAAPTLTVTMAMALAVTSFVAALAVIGTLVFLMLTTGASTRRTKCVFEATCRAREREEKERRKRERERERGEREREEREREGGTDRERER